MRVGIGYDVHRLVEGRKLILGGVDIPFEKGLLGHSDADVLVHAICDSLLGAAGLGDIGRHFPDTEPEYKEIYSILLLDDIHQKLTENNLEVENIDSVIIAERPKLSSYISQMKENIAHALKISIGQVNVKATSCEGLGFTGREEGMAAYAVALLDHV